MKQLYDIERYKSYRDTKAGLKLEGYNFILYYRTVESWYKGEDSGARYPDEWSDDIILEIYDLTPILGNIIDGVTLKEHIDKISGSKCIISDSLVTQNLWWLYYYLDDLPGVERLKREENNHLVE